MSGMERITRRIGKSAKQALMGRRRERFRISGNEKILGNERFACL